MASARDIVATITALPSVGFAQLISEGPATLMLYDDGRLLARMDIADTDQPALWSATQVVNALAHRALFSSPLADLPAGEAVNGAHQVVEWWDAMICAIAAISRRERASGCAADSAENPPDR